MCFSHLTFAHTPSNLSLWKSLQMCHGWTPSKSPLIVLYQNLSRCNRKVRLFKGMNKKQRDTFLAVLGSLGCRYRQKITYKGGVWVYVCFVLSWINQGRGWFQARVEMHWCRELGFSLCRRRWSNSFSRILEVPFRRVLDTILALVMTVYVIKI